VYSGAPTWPALEFLPQERYVGVRLVTKRIERKVPAVASSNERPIVVYVGAAAAVAARRLVVALATVLPPVPSIYCLADAGPCDHVVGSASFQESWVESSGARGASKRKYVGD